MLGYIFKYILFDAGLHFQIYFVISLPSSPPLFVCYAHLTGMISLSREWYG